MLLNVNRFIWFELVVTYNRGLINLFNGYKSPLEWMDKSYGGTANFSTNKEGLHGVPN